MKVLHIVHSIDRNGGGPSRSTQGLVAAQESVGVEAWLMTLVRGERPWVDGVRHFFDGTEPSEAIAKIAPDIVHIHGIWDPCLHKAVTVCRRWSIPYVIAPRGMLEPWSLKQKWLKKRVARFLYQDGDLKHAAALHATAESEAAQFRKLGFKNKVIISPNGVNVPDRSPNLKSKSKSGISTSQPSTSTPDFDSPLPRRALFVSRMHPKKGVLELVEAWARVFSRGAHVERGDWVCELVYTLNGDTERAYEAKVKQRILDLGMSYQDTDGTVHSSTSTSTFGTSPSSTSTFGTSPSSTSTSNFNFIFTGPLDDNAKWAAYARADLFVLPTYSENFGIVVSEALYAGVPVITTKGTPWQELETHCCGKWIDFGVESLAVALAQFFNLPLVQLRVMGENGRKLVEEKYTWTAACKSMITGYEKVLQGEG